MRAGLTHRKAILSRIPSFFLSPPLKPLAPSIEEVKMPGDSHWHDG